MAYVDWQIKGPKIASCNCAYGCPCEFNARPTNSICEGLEAHFIEEGWFGGVRLDGLVVCARYRWPGPVHEGGGVAQGVIDQRATDEQREALFAILGGKEQEPSTVFNIYGATIEKEYDPILAPIAFQCDFASRTGGFTVPGVMELQLEPIRNPVTGAPHQARIELPEGFEFRIAEVASGTFSGGGDIAFSNANTYGALTYVAYGPYGVIAAESALPPKTRYEA
ncbi:MAG: DUF1326 domain-containing protein [Methyloceanibacter sp.]|uniref:DUF1326 domain-containing protein n=1 Tax=Methyloceanibacter sp. TaxID=1965321 RepID=UPI003D6D898E